MISGGNATQGGFQLNFAGLTKKVVEQKLCPLKLQVEVDMRAY